MSWDDVRFTDNSFFNLSLYGDTSDFNKEPSRTPELTSIGSFDKGWKKENNEWWLYKVADDNQKYSEWLISEVGSKLLGFDMAYYVMNDDNTIKTLDFTENNKYNYEPMFSLIGANNDYNDNFNLLLNIDNNLAISYLKILYADTLFQNMDRHTFNYGLLRDSNTGQILKLAPNYDNNVALIYKGKLPSIDLPLIDNDLYDLLDQNATAVLMLNNINIPVINKDDLSKITNNIETSVDKDYLNDYIIKHQKMINDKIAYYKTNSNAFKK